MLRNFCQGKANFGGAKTFQVLRFAFCDWVKVNDKEAILK